VHVDYRTGNPVVFKQHIVCVGGRLFALVSRSERGVARHLDHVLLTYLCYRDIGGVAFKSTPSIHQHTLCVPLLPLPSHAPISRFIGFGDWWSVMAIKVGKEKEITRCSAMGLCGV
jgi:hypothetical protein